MKAPIFISGLRKSGTSLVKNLLDGHPELFVFPANELHLFRFSHHGSMIKDKQASESSYIELMKLIANQKFISRLNDPSARDYRPEVDVVKFQKDISSAAGKVRSHREVIETIFESMTRSISGFKGNADNVRFVAKSVLETEFVPELKEWFPKMQFIYVLRHPYGHFDAVRNSMRASGTKLKEGGKLSVIGQKYPYLGGEILRMKMSYYFMRKYRELYPNSFYVLVYDRLLEEPERELRQLVKFLGIQFNKILLQPTICEKPWGGNSWYVGTFDSIDKRPLTHWKERISKLEIRLINEYFSDVIEEFGFEKINTRVSILLPFHISERPKEYLANRLLFKAKIV